MGKTLVGTVVSDKPDQTIVVSIQQSKTHPIYKKQYLRSKRYMAHDAKNEAAIGDKVSIIECKPLSARKHFKLVKIIERPAIREDQSVDAVTPGEAKAEPKDEEKTE